MNEEVTHKEIYDRLVAVEEKVDNLTESTKDVTAAFVAAQGAFTVLETLSRLAKPLLWLGGLIVAVSTFWDHLKVK
jgi:hypothetical protein|tara:strand:- start:5464 stop:5691 length:228 start_codon:yes stop_codon:yes gene_type:complete